MSHNPEQEQNYDDTMQRMQKSTQSLKDTLKIAKETEQIGNDVLNELNRQGEQLAGMNDKIDKIDGKMIHSSSLLRNMERKWYDPRTWF